MWKIPAETEVAQRYTCTLLSKQCLHCWHCLHCLHTLFINTIKTALCCSNNSRFACIYCSGRLERYWNGLMRNEQNVWWYSLDCYDYQKELKVFWLKSSNFSFGHFGSTFVSWWIFLPRLIPRLELYRYPNCTDIILKARFIHLRYKSRNWLLTAPFSLASVSGVHMKLFHRLDYWIQRDFLTILAF